MGVSASTIRSAITMVITIPTTIVNANIFSFIFLPFSVTEARLALTGSPVFPESKHDYAISHDKEPCSTEAMRVLMSPPQNFSKYNFSFSVKELTASVGIWVIAASENRATFLVEDVILVESASLKFHFPSKPISSQSIQPHPDSSPLRGHRPAD